MTSESWISRPVSRFKGAARSEEVDDLAIEDPLEIRVAGETIAVTMRTPGQDEWLVAGFLLAEGIISNLHDVARIYHCGRPGTAEFINTIDVVPAPGQAFDLELLATSKRGALTTSACGVCGRKTIEDLVARCRPIEKDSTIFSDDIRKCVNALGDHQPNFKRTGGTHVAGIFDRFGVALNCCEDIGRHNAVDKAVGSLLYRDVWPEEASLLAISGRASFEMVQKAVTARLPFVASVSAASTLAVSLAERMGITVAGFVRENTLNVYTHAERVT